MAEHPCVPHSVTEAALAASPMIERFYCRGGGSTADLFTDMSHALAVMLPVARPYDGPERRRRVVDLADLAAQWDGVERRAVA